VRRRKGGVLGHTVVGNIYANNTPEAGEEAANG
jgi:hypothetical protein